MLSFKNFLKEELKKISGQLGSNPGGVHLDTETGKKYYMKFYDNADQAKSEVLSARIHEHLGGNTLNPEYVQHNGKHAVKTEWNPNLQNINPRTNLTPEHRDQIAKLYHGSVLTKNWDLVGTGHDNLGLDKKTGKVHIQDTGGSFNFRAQGGHKPYDKEIGEYRSLRDPKMNPDSASLLDHAFGKDNSVLKKTHRPLTSEDHSKIRQMFANSGISNWEELHKNFVERANKLDKLYFN